ncbi:DUF6281 family protein [Streptomyces parvus]|uniref:DUF6281 family protein n=1 Tax=Streptomyces parvus TaxID=66428 RepID=UPI0036E87679
MTGCTAGSGGEGEASCAFEVSYEGRTYKNVANVDFTVTDELGTADHHTPTARPLGRDFTGAPEMNSAGVRRAGTARRRGPRAPPRRAGGSRPRWRCRST